MRPYMATLESRIVTLQPLDKCILVLYSAHYRKEPTQECSRMHGRIGHYATQEEVRNVRYCPNSCAGGRGLYDRSSRPRPPYQRPHGPQSHTRWQAQSAARGQAIFNHTACGACLLRGIAGGRRGEGQRNNVNIPDVYLVCTLKKSTTGGSRRKCRKIYHGTLLTIGQF